MKIVGAYEAKTHLPKLLERVSRGERITITRHGIPVAVLQPADHEKKVDPALVIAQIKAFRSQHKLKGLPVRDMIGADSR